MFSYLPYPIFVYSIHIRLISHTIFNYSIHVPLLPIPNIHLFYSYSANSHNRQLSTLFKFIYLPTPIFIYLFSVISHIHYLSTLFRFVYLLRQNSINLLKLKSLFIYKHQNVYFIFPIYIIA